MIVAAMRTRALIAVGFLLCCWGVLRAQKQFREYPAIEYVDFPLPPDYQTPHDFVLGRLKYPDPYGPNLYWTMDYPRSDRHLLEGIRRLTRVDARSVEQVVEADDTDDIYNWPFIYGSEVGHWEIPPHVAERLRDFLKRGGFLMFDDFHGEPEWANFAEGMHEILPGVPLDDIPDDHPIFHTVYDLSHRIQVPGWGSVLSGVTYEKGGVEPHWRAAADEKGRLIATFCHNMDNGDAWEHSDNPRYPEHMASQAYRLAMNYIIYDLTH
jgi:hypothetical protein